MGSCYSGHYIAGDQITISNIGDPQQRYRLETVSNILQGGWGGVKHVTESKPLPLASTVVWNI